MELQSALEGSESRFVGLFVKGLGFLVRLGFKRSGGSWRVGSPEHHPFVKVSVKKFLLYALYHCCNRGFI